MRRRTATIALTLAVLTPLGAGIAVAASTQVAASTPVAASTQVGASVGKGRAEARPGPPVDRDRGKSFVLGGTLTGVDVASSSIDVTVRGGREKALRGFTVVLDVPTTAAVTRAGTAATLAELVVGDHVRVRTWRTPGTVTVVRVSASATATTPSATPTPTPTTTPTATPTP